MKNGLLKNQEQGEGNGNPLQYSCLGNPIDRGAWWATVQGVTHTKKNQEQEKDAHYLLSTLFYFTLY